MKTGDERRWTDFPLDVDERVVSRHPEASLRRSLVLAKTRNEARTLLRELAEGEIHLRIEGGCIRWTAMTSHGMTVVQIRAVKRLDSELKALLAARREG